MTTDTLKCCDTMSPVRTFKPDQSGVITDPFVCRSCRAPLVVVSEKHLELLAKAAEHLAKATPSSFTISSELGRFARMLKRLLPCIVAAIALTHCGPPADGREALPATRCGLRVEGVALAEAQQAEDVVVSTFASSLDPSLHSACAALNGWKLTMTSAPIVLNGDAPVLDDPNPSAPVDGVTEPGTWTIRVFSVHYIFAHEAAHVAQGCTEASGLHQGWDNRCGPRLKVCTCDNGKDNLGDPCTPGLVQPQLIDARAQLDALLEGSL